MTKDEEAAKDAAAERKRKRLEAWRKRQEQQKKKQTTEQPPPPPPAKKVSLSLGLSMNTNNKKKKINKKKKKKIVGGLSSFGGQDDDNNNDTEQVKKEGKKGILSFDEITTTKTNSKKRSRSSDTTSSADDETSGGGGKKKKRNRWDKTEKDDDVSMKDKDNQKEEEEDDDLDKFMNSLESGALGFLAPQQKEDKSIPTTTTTTKKEQQQGPVSGSVITAQDLELMRLKSSKGGGKGKLSPDKKMKKESRTEDGALYGPSDWESEATSASEAETEDEEEEIARQNFLKALKQTILPSSITQDNDPTSSQQQETETAQLASEVKSEKHRREERMKELEKEAEDALRASTQASQPDIGRIYYNDVEGGVMEEAERTLNVLNANAQDALEILADLNKKKELKAVDHSSVEYIPIRKNLYIVPRSLANLSTDDLADRRAKLKVRVRGRGSPAPVSTFAECGLSERILAILKKQRITTPFPIQAQSLPCILAGRDVIGVAKTGSGKTLGYLLPLLRHIGDQPPLGRNESGPIGLILAPARELAVQIYHVTKVFAKHLGIKSTAVYGGAGVAEQIADLKRGTHIAVATPGRMIDILTMQSGKILSLQRVSYVVMDEADRMFDMGFAPQISAILSAVRPDRQTVLFSATFPKTVEALARQSLKYPIEVLVGGRSVASDSVVQHGELIEESDKFLRLLQLLGEYVEEDKKAIIFVDTQSRADSVFEQLMRCGYPSLSLHGGKEQEDRDSTISDFKRKDGPNVLVATSVAGRGLDVPSCVCVINYSAPNHLEDYVHRVGRTGRAGNKGVAYTLVNSGDEAKFAPIVVRAMIEAGQAENVGSSLRELSDEFKKKVERGEARYAGSGFKGKGYSYDSSELSEAQKLVRLEKRQALIEAGMIDPDEEEPTTVENDDDEINNNDESTTLTKNTKSEANGEKGIKAVANLQAGVSAEILALPGMKEAIMKKAGIEVPSSQDEKVSGGVLSTGSSHFVEEMEINDYPREARWKVTQKETTTRLQDEFQTAVTLKGKYIAPNTQPEEGERRLYLHLEATSERVLQTCIQEIRRLLNEETLRVGTKGISGGHRYNVLA